MAVKTTSRTKLSENKEEQLKHWRNEKRVKSGRQVGGEDGIVFDRGSLMDKEQRLAGRSRLRGKKSYRGTGF